MKTIKLNEGSYKRLRSALVNEISVGTVDSAHRRSDKIFWHLKHAFDSFYDELEESISNVEWESNDNEMKSNPYLEKIKAYADAIQVILDSKMEQSEMFYDEVNKINDREFYNSPEADDNYLEDMELRDAQAKYPKK